MSTAIDTTYEAVLKTTAINGIRTAVMVVFDVAEKGIVNVFRHKEWQGTPERGGMVEFTDAIVIERTPTVNIIGVYDDATCDEIAIDETQRRMIAYQLTNEMDKENPHYYTEAE